MLMRNTAYATGTSFQTVKLGRILIKIGDLTPVNSGRRLTIRCAVGQFDAAGLGEIQVAKMIHRRSNHVRIVHFANQGQHCGETAAYGGVEMSETFSKGGYFR